MADENTITKPAADEVAKAEHTRSGRIYHPGVDILENDDQLVVLADVPGAKGDKIDVNFEDGTLTIHARVEPRQDKDTEYLLQDLDRNCVVNFKDFAILADAWLYDTFLEP